MAVTVEVYNSMIRQYVWEAVTNLLDGYYRFGFLYDKNGNLRPEYINVGCELDEDGLEGPLVDAEGCKMAVEKFMVDDWYELPMKFHQLNRYLDVHSNVHFDEKDWANIRTMNNGRIKKRYIGDSMVQLVAMLRRGHNYAMTKPVHSALSDEYLEDTICFVWRMLVLDTMNVHDVKKKYFVPGHEYYKKGKEHNYDWDKRPYYNRIADVEDVVVHKNGNVTMKFNTNQNLNKTSDELVAERKEEEAELLRVIGISMKNSDREKSLANKIAEQIDEAAQNFDEFDPEEFAAKQDTMAKRMARICKVY